MRARLVALLLCAAACESPTGPLAPTLHFIGQVVFGIPTLATQAEARVGGIKVTGVIPTPTAGYTLFGKITPSGRRLVLEVTAWDTGPGAPFSVQNYYEGLIQNLNPGDYDLQVVHVIHLGSVKEEQVLRQSIHVP